MKNDIMELMLRRHSSRCPFARDRPLSDLVLTQILEAARWAPTAHNMQNFEIVVVDQPAVVEALGQIPAEISETFVRESYGQLSLSAAELRRKKVGLLAEMFPPSWRTPHPDMAEIAREREHSSTHDTIHDSPSLLVVTYDPRKRAPASEGDFLGIMSLGCVLQSIWLMAESLGVAMQVMSLFSNPRTAEQVKAILAIPEPLRIAFAVRLGYAEACPRFLSVRRELADFVHYNRFGPRDQG